MTKVSVIIPLYNSARFLPSLFENIAQQTIAADMEFIFIDDHGSDDSLSVARSLAAASPFLKCLFGATAANGGPGVARNAGLKMAGGEYVAFLDSDDTLDAAFCEKLYDAATACDADMAYCHILTIRGSRQSIWRNPMVTDGEFDRSKRLYFLKNYKSFFTSFIYRREFLLREGIVFPPTRSAEDSCFLTEALLCAGSIAAVDEALYHYRLHTDSLSNRDDAGRSRQRRASFNALIAFAKEKNLYNDYRCAMDWIYFKKAILGTVRDWIKCI